MYFQHHIRRVRLRAHAEGGRDEARQRATNERTFAYVISPPCRQKRSICRLMRARLSKLRKRQPRLRSHRRVSDRIARAIDQLQRSRNGRHVYDRRAEDLSATDINVRGLHVNAACRSRKRKPFHRLCVFQRDPPIDKVGSRSADDDRSASLRIADAKRIVCVYGIKRDQSAHGKRSSGLSRQRKLHSAKPLRLRRHHGREDGRRDGINGRSSAIAPAPPAAPTRR